MIKKIVKDLSDAILITLLSALAYATYFMVQLGYFNYFGVPSDFISISLTNIVGTLVGIFILLTFIFLLLNGITTLIPDSLNIHIYNLLKNYLKLGVYFGLIFILTETNDIIEYIIIAFYLLCLLSSFIIPIFTQRKIKGYWNKIIESQKKIQTRECYEGNGKYTITKYLFERAPFIPILILIFIVLSFFAYNFGTTQARTQKSFTVIELENSNDFVLFGLYNGKLITSELDKDGYLEGVYLKESNDNMKYLEKEIGPLQKSR